MIERNPNADIWAAIAAPLPSGVMQWRQQGKPKARDGKFYALFVAYIDAHFVRERLDAVVPGEWDLTIDPLKELMGTDGESVDADARISFKGRLQILGVIREDVGSGKDYKQASTDAFKRAAVRFGIGTELYALDPIWVEVDGDGKYAKPVEDPAAVFARKSGQPVFTEERQSGNGTTRTQTTTATAATSTSTADPLCPKCDGRMWDNRLTKRNPKAPDWKCRDRSCDGVVWPPKDGAAVVAQTRSDAGPLVPAMPDFEAGDDGSDDPEAGLPF